ncbi:choice-of-anchor C family protein [Rhodovulum sp. 12E13]|uniref:choice-of-anchor C family protein n=1 Tax=Rhodovulum sp. 12E13 TaxID=2203891 RepID=UPI000E126808|nr:choice-of-anchor C family protein [Rhodovulum sp. 12E13]RDC73465.1 choice-of-anchor C family protein [Rhodovulum sp. 12E13]
MSSLPGWTVDSGTVDLVPSAVWEASDGSQSLDLNGDQKGAISQALSGFSVGQRYALLFDLAGNPDGGSGEIKSLQVSVGGRSDTFDFDTTGTSSSSMGWVTESFFFTAGAESMTLAFESLTDSPEDTRGPALDNLRISEAPAVIPLPAPGLLLIGALGGLAALRRRRA